jgi:Raf kinase inhibitor-like YbhB/YbcL family protein
LRAGCGGIAGGGAGGGANVQGTRRLDQERGLIPEKYAFCAPAARGHTADGQNISPSLSWSAGPAGTKSYAVIVRDDDAPTAQHDKMNKEGVTLEASVPRGAFYHAVVIDISPKTRSIEQGALSDTHMIHGQLATAAKVGTPGLNDYTRVTAANESMKGLYFGYDGPCPPWNDERPHHYHFMVFALSVPALGLSGAFTAPQALEAMKGKILAQGEEIGLYALNPAVIVRIEGE